MPRNTQTEREEQFRYHGEAYVLRSRYERATGYLRITGIECAGVGMMPLPEEHGTYLTDRDVRIAAERCIEEWRRGAGRAPRRG